MVFEIDCLLSGDAVQNGGNQEYTDDRPVISMATLIFERKDTFARMLRRSG